MYKLITDVARFAEKLGTWPIEIRILNGKIFYNSPGETVLPWCLPLRHFRDLARAWVDRSSQLI
jgi:hypothetical protein